MNAVHFSPGHLLVSLTLASTMFTACDSDSNATSGGGGQGGDTSSSSSSSAGGGGSGGAGVESFYSCVEDDYAEARPLSGANFDVTQGGFLMEPAQSTFVAHTTQIYVRPDGEDEFFQRSGELFGVLAETPGLVAWTVGTSETCGVARTMGIWESEEALYAFVAGDVHAQAMARTTALSFTGKTTHFDVSKEEAEALSWDGMRAELEGIDPSPLYR